jgi:hypothetical protein
MLIRLLAISKRCILAVAEFYHEDGGRMYLRNGGNMAHIHTANTLEIGISNNNGPEWTICFGIPESTDIVERRSTLFGWFHSLNAKGITFPPTSLDFLWICIYTTVDKTLEEME